VIRFLVPVPPRPGREPRRFHGVKELIATLLAQHLAEEGAEKAHVTAQGAAVTGAVVNSGVHRHGPSSDHESLPTATHGNPRPGVPREVCCGVEGSLRGNPKHESWSQNQHIFSRHMGLIPYGPVGCMRNQGAAVVFSRSPHALGPAILTFVEGSFMLDLHSMITAPLFPAPVVRRPRRHQTASAQGETPSTLTPDVLSCAPNTITNLQCPSLTCSMGLGTGDMRREFAPIPQLVSSPLKHVSSQCFGIANRS